uniref:Ribosomal protein S4 n=1 Tax=Jakoba bahamiensis TaxID=221721 RepID=M4QL02_9EUKA|nr:ribosomal protein S4 [Jakoba bahamiensis]AGH24133.1 ribosomal protein S4 [Jakoba bahamiensis]
MTKRIASKRKVYLQTGEDLWGKSHLLWKKSEKWKYTPGEHKKRHRSSERLTGLNSSQDLQYMFSLGYLTSVPSEKVRISYHEPRYSTLLREKQKLKKTYINMNENQFESLYHSSRKNKGKVSENLLKLLEKRLDMCLVRSAFAVSLCHARQLISHGHVSVNNQCVYNHNHYLNSGDFVAVDSMYIPNAAQLCMKSIKQLPIDYFKSSPNLEIDYHTMSFIYLYSPEIETIPYYISYNLDQIIRYYS